MDTMTPTLKPFTVLLLYPDYAAHNYGEETWTAHVHAVDVQAAQRLAQLEAMAANGYEEGDDPDYPDNDPNDWLPLFVCEGHVNNIAETE